MTNAAIAALHINRMSKNQIAAHWQKCRIEYLPACCSDDICCAAGLTRALNHEISLVIGVKLEETGQVLLRNIALTSIDTAQWDLSHQMKRALVFLVFCSIWPVPAIADSLIDRAVRLAERPDADLEEFMELVSGSFVDPVQNYRYLRPEDVPSGHHDPQYWSVSFFTTVEGHRVTWQCNRIGRESDRLLRTPGYRGLNTSKSFADLVDPNVTLQGVWPDPMPTFANDAVARLDCSIDLGQLVIDADAAAKSLEMVFSDVQINDDMPNLFGSGFFLIEASRGELNSNRKLDNAIVTSIDTFGPNVRITSWLLLPNS